MAESFHAAGPTRLLVSINNASPAYTTDFARTDNDDLVGFEIEDILRRFTRNDLGDMTAEIVTTGSVCHITFTSTYWDESVLQQILNMGRFGSTSGTEGTHATVGGLVVSPTAASRKYFGFKILTTNTGEKSYTFPRCVLAAPVGNRELGNTMKKLVMTLEALPDGSGVFYTAATN